jgi:hypothetical protein
MNKCIFNPPPRGVKGTDFKFPFGGFRGEKN